MCNVQYTVGKTEKKKTFLQTVISSITVYTVTSRSFKKITDNKHQNMVFMSFWGASVSPSEQ